MSAIWTRAQTEFLIQELELHPVLHQVHTPNKDWKEQSCVQLRDAIQELRPGTTVDDIKRKVKSLRDQYRRENLKHKQARKEGNLRHKSQLWCYSMLTFFNQSDDDEEDIPPPVKIKKSDSPVPSSVDCRKTSVKSPTYSDLEDSTADGHMSNMAARKSGRPRKINHSNEMPKRFLEDYLKRKEGAKSEHTDFLQYIASQLARISDYDVLYRTKMGILSELEAGVREQKETNDFKISQTDGDASTSSQMFRSHFVAVPAAESQEVEEIEDDLLI